MKEDTQEDKKVEPVVVSSKVEEKQEAYEPPKFNNLEEAFGSIASFFQTTKNNVQKPLDISKAANALLIPHKMKANGNNNSNNIVTFFPS